MCIVGIVGTVWAWGEGQVPTLPSRILALGRITSRTLTDTESTGASPLHAMVQCFSKTRMRPAEPSPSAKASAGDYRQSCT